MRKKVLVVDDSQLMHRMYDLALKAYARHELEPHFASDGFEGLTSLHDHPDVEVIMLDVNMPSMSGLEFLERVKAEDAFRDIPVVLQSTEDSEDDIARGLEAGAYGYLTKPFTPQRLHTLLDEVLS